jgi:hypothetical protein
MASNRRIGTETSETRALLLRAAGELMRDEGYAEVTSRKLAKLHVRDISANQPQGYRIAMGSPVVGAGNLDWARMLPAAYRAGARHFLVEQEPQSGSAPMAAAEGAFAYLSQLRA